MSVTRLAAVILTTGDAARLALTLGSLSGAEDVVLLDVAECAGRALPASARRLADPRAIESATDAPWLLLLKEGEVVSKTLGREIAAVVAAPCSYDVFAVPVVVRALDARLRLRRPAARLARRGARVRLDPGLAPCLQVDRGPVGLLTGAIVVRPPATLAEAVVHLSAEATMLSALLEASGAQPSGRMLVRDALLETARVALARGEPVLGWVRWILAVLCGYRAVATHAKLWELRHARAEPAA